MREDIMRFTCDQCGKVEDVRDTYDGVPHGWARVDISRETRSIKCSLEVCTECCDSSPLFGIARTA